MLKKILIVAGIIALGFLARWASAEDMWKVQAHIQLAKKAKAVETYLNANKKSTDIRLGKANVEVSVTKRDGKVLHINLFFKSLEEAKKVYDYLVKQAKDMQDIGSKEGVSRSKILLIKDTNHIPLCQRRYGSQIISSYTKE